MLVAPVEEGGNWGGKILETGKFSAFVNFCGKSCKQTIDYWQGGHFSLFLRPVTFLVISSPLKKRPVSHCPPQPPQPPPPTFSVGMGHFYFLFKTNKKAPQIFLVPPPLATLTPVWALSPPPQIRLGTKPDNNFEGGDGPHPYPTVGPTPRGVVGLRNGQLGTEEGKKM